MTSTAPLLQINNLSKSFPGVKALDNVSLKVEAGTVHALMGENGAGKSTLMKCLFGVNKRDSGEILIEGVPVDFRSPSHAMRGGVAMVHQELNQALTMSVMDNMWLGRFPRVMGLPFISKGTMRKKTEDVFRELGITLSADTNMGKLSVAKRQLVEIAKAVSCGAKIIAFDEPTSSLNDNEAEILFEIIAKLKADGCGIIYISHKMSEILQISDYVTVMRDGKYIATEPKENLTTDKIIKMMVGRKLKNRFPERQTQEQYEELLRVENLSGEHSLLRDVSFSLGKGEILGIAGLDGSGRTELLETVFGLAKKSGGEIILEGKRVRNSNPEEAKKNGFALLTEERRSSGIFGILNIRDNTTVSSNPSYRRFMLLSERMRRKATDECIRSMRIKTPTQDTKIRTLSGGNQQKVILGRWLLTDPKVLMLDEPTRGIDVGAKYEIYVLIANLAKSGRGVIVVSSEMPELLGLCDRILVMSNGRLAGEVNAKSATQEQIMTLSTKNL